MYQKWIDTYSGEEFGALVEAVLKLTDRICEDLNSLVEDVVFQLVVQAVVHRLELVPRGGARLLDRQVETP